MSRIDPPCLALAVGGGFCGVVKVFREVDTETMQLMRTKMVRCSICKKIAHKHPWWICEGLPDNCDIASDCVLYPLDGDDSLPDEGEQELAPPEHVNCRCVIDHG